MSQQGKPLQHRRTTAQERFTRKMRLLGRDPMPLRLQTIDPAKVVVAVRAFEAQMQSNLANLEAKR